MAGLVALLVVSSGKPWHLAACSIYGGSLILLYSASTLYHSLRVEPRRVEQLRMLDQAAIYCLIAGTYTPICLIALPGIWGWSLLGAVWGIGFAGAAVRLAWRGFPDWLSFTLYFTMGLLFVFAVVPIVQSLSPSGVTWLLFGGLCYTVGAAALALERPRLWPGVFGSHDLWHVFVLGGSACHYVMIRYFVVHPAVQAPPAG